MIEFYEDGAIEQIGIGAFAPLTGPKKWISIQPSQKTWWFDTAYGPRSIRDAKDLTVAGVVNLLQKRDPDCIVKVDEPGELTVWHVGTVRMIRGQKGPAHRVYCEECNWSWVGDLRFAANHQNHHEADRRAGYVSANPRPIVYPPLPDGSRSDA